MSRKCKTKIRERERGREEVERDESSRLTETTGCLVECRVRTETGGTKEGTVERKETPMDSIVICFCLANISKRILSVYKMWREEEDVKRGPMWLTCVDCGVFVHFGSSYSDILSPCSRHFFIRTAGLTRYPFTCTQTGPDLARMSQIQCI